MRVRVLLAACSLAIALAACPVEGARAAETAGDETGSAAVATAPSGENSVGEGLTLEGDEPEGVDAAGPADKQEQAVVADAEEPVAAPGDPASDEPDEPGEKSDLLHPSEPAGEEGSAGPEQRPVEGEKDPELGTPTEPEASEGAETGVESGAETDVEPGADDEVETEPATEVDDEPEADAEPEAESRPAAKPDPQPEADVLLDASKAEAAQEPADPESATDPEPVTADVTPKVSPAGQGSASGSAKTKVSTVTTYRLYNPNSGEHFYTQSAYERDSLVKAGWRSEGVGWTAVSTSSTPVYRLYNPYAGDHHYTTSVVERDSLRKAGWRYEGIGWYSDDAKGVPLYRQYNPYAKTGTHNYTASALENLNLISAGWRFENVAWYAVDLGPVAPSGNFSGWAENGGSKFYGYGDGTHATGWQTIDGTRYHFDAKGRLSTGLSYIDGTYYSLSSSGAPESGWKDYAGYRYYFNSDGSMYKNGWLELDGKTYYLDKTSGAMATGDKWIDGVLRPFASNGVCLKTGYQVSWKGLHLAAENVSLPSYANGSSWSYVHPCTISAGATREQCIEAFIAVAYEYMNAGTPWVDNNCGRPGTTVDCSGLVMEGLYAAGMDLTGVAGGDFNPYSKYYWNHSFANTWRENQTFQPVSRSELERGDLVYWNGHVAIYLGNGQIIESTSVASNVRVRSLYAENLILGYARPFTK